MPERRKKTQAGIREVLPMMRKRFAVAALVSIIALSECGAYDIRNPLYFGVFPGFEALLLSAATGVGLLVAGTGCPGEDGVRDEYPLYVNVAVGTYPSYRDSDALILDARIGGGFYVAPWFALGLEASVANLRDGPVNTAGFSGFAYMRWRVPAGESLALVLDYGFGRSRSLAPFPSGGTVGNFTPIYGLGLITNTSGSQALCAGSRHFHLSNGTSVDNPGFNSNGLFVGYEFR
jgi:hypothetical protein